MPARYKKTPDGYLPLDGVPVNDGAAVNSQGYSTTEQATGETWIDGKPIYRRVYPINNPTQWNNAIIDLGVAAEENLAEVIDYRITIQSSASNQYRLSARFVFRELRFGVLANGNYGGYMPVSIGSLAANTGVLMVWYTKT
jgi:hypothetical protein